jgi:branched-chain amino acid transport system substrate-binding protein
MILFDTLDKLKEPGSEQLTKALAQLKNFQGVTGVISFDKNGDAVKSAVIPRMEKDGPRYVTTVRP